MGRFIVFTFAGLMACSAGHGATGGSGVSIRAAIAEAPACPGPPAGIDSAAASRWLAECVHVGEVAADNVARGMDEARRRGDVVSLGCLQDEHHAIVSMRRRISAERIALAGPFAERSIARVRLMCLRIHRMVTRAQTCGGGG